MRVKVAHPEDRAYVEAVTIKVMSVYDGRGIAWEHPDNDPELWKLNSGQRAGVVGVDLNGRRSCVKLFYDNRWRAKLRNLIGLPKAKRAYAQAIKLKQQGVDCPAMIGLVCIKASGPYLVVSELCDYAMRTDHHIIQHGITSGLVEGFAAFVRHMHESGISHDDFSLRNTLVVKNETDYQFLLLDYEDAHFYSRLPCRKRQQNLHHLLERALMIVPLKWRILFLKEYLQTQAVRNWVEEINILLKKHPSKYTKDLSL